VRNYQHSSHATYEIQYHFVWITKYRYKVLKPDIAIRLRDMVRQGCEAREITVISGNIRPDHVHILVSAPPWISPSQIMQYLKGRSSRLLQDEFSELKRRYWGRHLWGRGYFCTTVGPVTEEMIKNYIENQHDDDDSIKIEPDFQS
jgi:putative transposase